MLSPSQKQTIDLFKNKPNQEQANEIAQKCNELGISKQDLEQIVGLLKRR
jgi:16S rRNA U1498 N3-methylase RsmE